MSWGSRQRSALLLQEHRREDHVLLKQLLTYEVLSTRTTAQNALIWQTPALALTAQAFLLTIALGADTSTLARCMSSALAVVLSVLSWQLMLKHAVIAHRDRDRLEKMESDLGMPVLHGKDAFTDETFWKRPSSQKMWRRGLLIFGVVAAAVFVVALVAPGFLA
jgi:hypothetical protein